jgi:hypothetical protein
MKMYSVKDLNRILPDYRINAIKKYDKIQLQDCIDIMKASLATKYLTDNEKEIFECEITLCSGRLDSSLWINDGIIYANTQHISYPNTFFSNYFYTIK